MASMVPPTYPLSIYQGDTFVFTFRVRGRTRTGGPGQYVDLTGCTPKAQIRADEDSVTVIAEFEAELEDQTTSKGQLSISLDHADTAALDPVAEGAEPYVYDIQLTYPGGAVQTVLRGNITVIEEVTR